SVRSFTVQAAPATIPGAPTLVSPANGATNQPTSVTLSWNAPSTGTTPFTYDVWLALDSGFTNVIGASTGQSGTNWTTGILSIMLTFYWRVRAKSRAGTGSWRSVRSCTVPP